MLLMESVESGITISTAAHAIGDASAEVCSTGSGILEKCTADGLRDEQINELHDDVAA